MALPRYRDFLSLLSKNNHSSSLYTFNNVRAKLSEYFWHLLLTLYRRDAIVELPWMDLQRVRYRCQ